MATLAIDERLDRIGVEGTRRPAVDRSGVAAGGRRRTDDRTLKARMAEATARLARRLVLVSSLCLLFLPLLLAALVTLDLPLGWFDGWASRRSLAASNWLSRGEGLLALSVFLLILMTRRHGALIVSRVQGSSWLVAVGLSAGMLAYLAPELTQADMPRGRYVLGVVVSWFVGQQVAIQLYDVLRGGVWWRAPFYAGLFGFGAQVAIFFPLAYGGTGAVWPSWMALDYCLKILASCAFLLIYWLVRGRVRPLGGLGGAA